jgi:hypothetical protein
VHGNRSDRSYARGILTVTRQHHDPPHRPAGSALDAGEQLQPPQQSRRMRDDVWIEANRALTGISLGATNLFGRLQAGVR